MYTYWVHIRAEYDLLRSISRSEVLQLLASFPATYLATLGKLSTLDSLLLSAAELTMGRVLVHLLTTLLANFRIVQGMPWAGPTQTAESDSLGYLGWNPRPTQAPIAYLSKRDVMVAPNICGWVDGISTGK